MRTFTYLNLYGYLTDAVVVNRLLPRGGLLRRLARGAGGAARAGALRLRAGARARRRDYFEREVVGDRDARPPGRRRSSTTRDPAAMLHTELSQELVTDNGSATLRVAVPFAERGDLEPEEDRTRGDRAGGRPEAHDHAAARPGRLRRGGARFEDGALRDLVREDEHARLEPTATTTTAAAPTRPPPPPPAGPDPAALFVLLDGMRRTAPRELEGQVTNLIREFLLTLRSLIDWYLERLDREPPSRRSRTSRSSESASRLAGRMFRKCGRLAAGVVEDQCPRAGAPPSGGGARRCGARRGRGCGRIGAAPRGWLSAIRSQRSSPALT